MVLSDLPEVHDKFFRFMDIQACGAGCSLAGGGGIPFRASECFVCGPD